MAGPPILGPAALCGLLVAAAAMALIATLHSLCHCPGYGFIHCDLFACHFLFYLCLPIRDILLLVPCNESCLISL